MKILVIGQGFIGSKVIKQLKNKHQVDIFDLEFGDDIRDYNKVLARTKGCDAVLLIAAVADLNQFEANPQESLDINIDGLINVATACMFNKCRLYFISTCCVYGNTKDLPSSEESIPNPSEIYACAKLAGEWIVKGFNKSYGLEYVILRIATCYGPNMRSALAPAVFINQINKGEPITIHGDGKQTRTLTYIDDEVDGIVAVINSGIKNETFNISTEEEKSVNDWVNIIKQEMKAEDHPIMYVENRNGQTFKEQIDASKANKLLNWRAKVSFREGIRETLEWMQKEGITKI